MANGFGSLWVGASGIQSASNGLNTTANNLSNVNTEGYVREQVVYEDRTYLKIGNASVSTQYSGLGVDVGTIVHARDIFLDKAYRTENGRYSFYSASSEAVQEVETFLQESDGKAFQSAIADFYEAFAEFAKDPSDTVNQNLVLQKASLFLSRSTAVEEGFEDYQTIINEKITEDVDRINEIGNQIVEYNKKIMAIEAGSVEQAMELRDKRDLLLDELSGLCRISYDEDARGNVHVQVEGMDFVDEINCNEIALEKDLKTGFVTPYWPDISDPDNDEYYEVFNMDNVSAENNSDIGEIKALLLARGDHKASYLDLQGIDSDTYENGIGNSIMMNSEAELDTLLHQLVTGINDLFSPTDTFESVYGQGTTATYVDADGNTVTIDPDTIVCDINNADVGADGELPPRELFVRNGTERYTTVTATITDADGNETTAEIYLYNEETLRYSDAEGNEYTIPASQYVRQDGDIIVDTSCCYTMKSLDINEELMEKESYLPYKSYSDQTTVDYSMGEALEAIWSEQNFNLNPSDTTPCCYKDFYTKWVGEIATVGSVYETTSTSLQGTSEQIESSRQGVIGVSSDEELTNMIKYQNAYNAASRYINVVNEMIEHLITSMGA